MRISHWSSGVCSSDLRWFVPLARRIDKADGSFAGVVVAAIEPLFFERTYRRLQLNDEDSVALFHADSTMIARVPQLPEMYGQNMSNLRVFSEDRKSTRLNSSH